MDKSPTKPRKAPARKPGVLPYATKIQILNWLLRGHPSAATDPKTLKNELRILGILLKSYPVPAFWLSLRIALDLQSMCFFLCQYLSLSLVLCLTVFYQISLSVCLSDIIVFVSSLFPLLSFYISPTSSLYV